MVRVGTSKGSTISHMAAVHPGHYLPGALQKEEDETPQVVLEPDAGKMSLGRRKLKRSRT